MVSIIFIYTIFINTQVTGVDIELDLRTGLKINFHKMNLDKNAYENFSSSTISIEIKSITNNKTVEYSFRPTNLTSNQIFIGVNGSLAVNKNSMHWINYPLQIIFRLKTDNPNLLNVKFFNNSNTISGLLHFDDSGDVYLQSWDYLEPIDNPAYAKFINNKYDLNFILILHPY